MALHPGTRVTLLNLVSRADLNYAQGKVAAEWDGERYSVRLADSDTVVRVNVSNLAPINVHAFVTMQRRLSYELYVFANHYNSAKICNMYPVQEKNIHPLGKALSETTTRVELCHKSEDAKCVLLRLYRNDDAKPYAQLIPQPASTEVATEVASTTPEVPVLAFDTPTAIEDIGGVLEAGAFFVVCQNVRFLFWNVYPLFHLSIERMLELVTMPAMLSLNTIDLVRFNESAVQSFYYCAEEGFLIFETEGVTCHVVDFQWHAAAFRLTRHMHATNHKMRMLASMQKDALHASDPLPDQVPVFVKGLSLIHI